MSWSEQQEEWRRQYAELGLPVPAQPLQAPYAPRPVNEVAKDFALQLAFTATPFPFARQLGSAARGVGSAARGVGNFFAPRRVGVHHTVAGTHLGGVKPNVLPYWQAPYIRPSSAQYGKQGVTSSDQISGMSYFWDATGNNARRAATEGVNQPNMVIANNIFGNDTVSRALTVTAPRFKVLNDVNPGVQGGVARMVPGENQLRVVGEVAGRQGTNVRIPGTRVDVPGGLPPSAIDDIAGMVNRQKLIEAGKSVGKIGTAVAGGGAANRNIDMAALRQMLR